MPTIGGQWCSKEQGKKQRRRPSSGQRRCPHGRRKHYGLATKERQEGTDDCLTVSICSTESVRWRKHRPTQSTGFLLRLRYSIRTVSDTLVLCRVDGEEDDNDDETRRRAREVQREREREVVGLMALGCVDGWMDE